jgi:hypothetical protein
MIIIYDNSIIKEDNLLFSTYNKLKLLKKYNYVFDDKVINKFINLSYPLKIIKNDIYIKFIKLLEI